MLLLMEQHCGMALAQLCNTEDKIEGILVMLIVSEFL